MAAPYRSYAAGSLDITMRDDRDIEIKIRRDGKVIWINIPECVLRICAIGGKVLMVDERTISNVPETSTPED